MLWKKSVGLYNCDNNMIIYLWHINSLELKSHAVAALLFERIACVIAADEWLEQELADSNERFKLKALWELAEYGNLDEINYSIQHKQNVNLPNPITLDTPL